MPGLLLLAFMQATDSAGGTSIQPNGLRPGYPQYEGTVISVPAEATSPIPMFYWYELDSISSNALLCLCRCAECAAYAVAIPLRLEVADLPAATSNCECYSQLTVVITADRCDPQLTGVINS
jgi:hypothetical protein